MDDIHSQSTQTRSMGSILPGSVNGIEITYTIRSSTVSNTTFKMEKRPENIFQDYSIGTNHG